MKNVKSLGIGVAGTIFVVVVVSLMLGATSQNTGMVGMNMPGMMTDEMDMTSQLAALEGEAFEVGFMSMMITHHESATEMAQWILERSEDSEITRAAQKIIDEQETEIMQMTTWLREWYGQEPDAEMMGMMQEMMGGMMQTMMDAKDPERAFLEGMSEHHDGAIDMAQLALFRSTHEQLRGLAEKVVRDQAGEISQFQTWLAGR